MDERTVQTLLAVSIILIGVHISLRPVLSAALGIQIPQDYANIVDYIAALSAFTTGIILVVDATKK